MANTTFNGPVTSLNGFIGGPNPNAGASGTPDDTQQGGNVVYSFSNTTTLIIASGAYSGTTLLATTNRGVMTFTSNCISGNAGYVFSDGTTWKMVNAPTTSIASS
ncbi:hypothetical protein EB001_26810 [bacterium]|jgi:hypothetical protein|nr:hypothetical protein [bacterium]